MHLPCYDACEFFRVSVEKTLIPALAVVIGGTLTLRVNASTTRTRSQVRAALTLETGLDTLNS
jgi:hypothetical protein